MISIPSGEWPVVVALLQAAKQSDGAAWNAAFVPVAKLTKMLLDPLATNQLVTRLIYKIRLRFRSSQLSQHLTPPEDEPHDWGLRAIEKHDTLGYRIRLLPKNVDLRLQEFIPTRNSPSG